MKKTSRASLIDNLKDIERLLNLHEKEGGTSQGRRYGLEVLNKSAIVLLTAYWEAFCEDLAAEALEHLVKHARSSDSLPVSLKKQIAKELSKETNHLAIWEISDDKWRDLLQKRLQALQVDRNRKLNSPKTENIDRLFDSSVGIAKISSAWSWPKKMTVKRASEKLDRFVEFRGAIAHRGSGGKSARKVDVVDYRDFIKRLAARTAARVNYHMRRTTGKSLFILRTRRS